jgi:ribosomal protein L19
MSLRRAAVGANANMCSGRREIIIHESPRSEAETCKEPISVVDKSQLALLDPTGARSKLFDKTNKDRAKVGDILLATFASGEPVSGVILSIKGSGPHTSVLLRNNLTGVGMEMQVKVHSPLVQSMEIAQRAPKRKRRARIYYLRKPEHDMGSVQKVVDQYLRQRAMLTGGKPGSHFGRSRPKKGKR